MKVGQLREMIDGVEDDVELVSLVEDKEKQIVTRVSGVWFRPNLLVEGPGYLVLVARETSSIVI